MYKEALELKLRFNTNKGVLTPEQLFDLSVEDLDQLAVGLEESYKNSKGKSFIDKQSTKDKKLKLSFDIVLDVLNTKLEKMEEAQTQAENKAHNEKIISLIADKQDEELKGKSVSQLKAMLR